MVANLEATIDDLYALPREQKAEIVDGEILLMSPTGAAPGYAASEIFVSLRAYSRAQKKGYAVNDNAAFRVDLPNRKSFSPDADLLGDEVVKSYRSNEPNNPTIYGRGEVGRAEPGVPGWSITVDDLFI